MKDLISKADPQTRRHFMMQAASTCLGVGMLTPFGESMIFGASASAKSGNPGFGKAQNVIYLYLAGGLSHLDSLDPKPGADTAGEFKAIGTKVPGVKVSEHLPQLARHLNEIALVRSMTSKQGAHDRGQYVMHTSYNPLSTVKHASIGSWMVKAQGKANRNLPGQVVIGGGAASGAGILGAQYEPLTIGNPQEGLKNCQLPYGVTRKQFDHRRQLVSQLNRSFEGRYPHTKVNAYNDYYADAVRLMQSGDVKAFDIKKEPSKVAAEYGEHRFAQGCMLARRLVENGVRFVEVTFGGWDTHQDNFERLGDELLPALDKAISALLTDLKRRDLLETTLVVLTTEFGRTPRINERGGRDHYPKVFSAMVAGGGVQGGQVYGSSDAKGAFVKDDAVTPADLNASIAYAMGVDHRKKVISSIGRPFTLSNEGTPVVKLFGRG